MLNFRNNRFFGMINNFLTFLTTRKRAYTGRPSSAMYYDEKKKRWVIDGEDESDDDIPPPPPPKKNIQAAVAKEENKKEPESNKQNAAEALAKPMFSGALANRGRGRGARGGASMANRFP